MAKFDEGNQSSLIGGGGGREGAPDYPSAPPGGGSANYKFRATKRFRAIGGLIE